MLPEYIEPVVLLFLGYPSKGFSSPRRHETERKKLEKTVFFEAYTE